MEMQNPVDEVERLLQLENLPPSPPPLERARGYQLGKLLHSAKQTIDTVVEVERLLQVENLPASPPQGGNAAPVQRTRGYHLGKLLRAAKQIIEPLDPAAVKAKAFIAYAKTSATIAATVCNAINLFGCTIGYMIHDNSSIRLKGHLSMRHVFIAMTLSFLPFTVLTAGLASTLKPKRSHNSMMNIVAIMLYMEIAYMAAMFSLFCYYLIDGSQLVAVLSSNILVALFLIAVPFTLYHRPGVWECMVPVQQ